MPIRVSPEKLKTLLSEVPMTFSQVWDSLLKILTFLDVERAGPQMGVKEPARIRREVIVRNFAFPDAQLSIG
jgi:hypothetical protein